MSWKKHFTVIKSAPVMPQVDRSTAYSSTTARTSSWLNIAYQGNPQRIPRYYQFQEMDSDSDINTALDTIADFCTQSEEQSDEPFEVKFNGEPNESEVKIIKQMLARWIKLNSLRSRLWYMFRDTIKNGDAFFLRDPETQEWLWLDHFMVELVKVDESKGKVPDEYIIRGLDYNRQTKFGSKQADPNAYRTPFGTSTVGGARPMGASGSSSPASFSMVGTDGDQRQRGMQGPFSQELSVVDAQFVVHLSLSIGNDINWPFGPSILEPIFKTFKQKELLEDAIIIYRVQRAPERRIFYIDVGTMPPERAKRHIEAIKNDIHQRRIPSRNGAGGSLMDATYNPLSINDDYFFACLHLETKILLLDGRSIQLRELISEHQQGKQNWVYSQNTSTHVMEPGRIKWAGITRKKAELMRITLDSGEYVDVTPDHRFIARNGAEIEAADLQPGFSLMPLYLHHGRTGPKQKNAGYTRHVCNASNKTKFVHTSVCPKPVGREWVVHHKDFCGENNNPTNLEVMARQDHSDLHHAVGTYSLQKQWNDEISRAKLIAGMRKLYDEASPDFMMRLAERNRTNGKRTWDAGAEVRADLLLSLRKHSGEANLKRKLKYSLSMFERLVQLFDEGYDSISKLCPVLEVDIQFQEAFQTANCSTQRDKNIPRIGAHISDKTLNETVGAAGYQSWSEFKTACHRNHEVRSVEYLPYLEDTGDITIETASGSHLFALAVGIFVHNSSSEGRGSKVETLPGGDGNNEILDLTFFSKKLARGLRVPTSYLNIGDDASNSVTFNDGKLGAAMIQEYRFSKYCMRLQSLLAPKFDHEFKRYLVKNGIEIEASLFELQFNPPQSFTRYRQIELDTQRVAVYQGVAENKKLSERFKLKRFLGLSEDEIIENEEMWSEENADKLKKKTGASPAEGGDAEGLSAVGIHPEGDMGMGAEMPEAEMPEGTDPAAGGAGAGAPGAAPPAAAAPGGAAPAGG